jgi:hypothetical protein
VRIACGFDLHKAADCAVCAFAVKDLNVAESSLVVLAAEMRGLSLSEARKTHVGGLS